VLARQAGTAAAFGPLIDALEGAGETVLVAALGAAANAWTTRGAITGERFSDLVEALEATARPRVLVTGTSAEAEDDARSWRWARERGIPTVAFVDSWINYALRFEATDGGWVSPLPDTIAAVDEAAARRLVEAGLPADRITALGSPAFDELASRASPLPSVEGGLEILFASQPLAGRGLPTPWDERRALTAMLTALEALGPRGPITLRVRLHPAEPRDAVVAQLSGWSASNVTVQIDDRHDRLEAVTSAHLVVGIVSMLLVEAQWLGRPALSVQPGGRAPSDLLDLHGVPVVSDAAALERAMVRCLSGSAPEIAAPRPATPRWLDMLRR
jgi:hypothetical protein